MAVLKSPVILFKSPIDTTCCVAAAGSVTKKRVLAGGRILAASGVETECALTDRPIVAANRVARHRAITRRRVQARRSCFPAGRRPTVGSVEDAFGVTRKPKAPVAVFPSPMYLSNSGQSNRGIVMPWC